jgi:hypothetical protein
MGSSSGQKTDIMGWEDLDRHFAIPFSLPPAESAPDAPPAINGIDYSQLPSYPRVGPELPPADRTDFLWHCAEIFAGSLIACLLVGALALLSGLVIAINLLVQGADLLETGRALGTVTLIGLAMGVGFGLWIDDRRAVNSHIRGD